MTALLAHKIDEIIALCKQHRVKSIALFGSAARDAMTPDSDVDFLVEFEETLDVLEYADNYFSLLEGLEQLTGRKIDLLSVHSLRNPVLKEEIFRSKIELYAA